MKYGSITSREMQYLPVRTISKKKDYSLLILVVLLALAVGIFLDNFTTLTTATPVHAEEKIHQNDYYCAQWRQTQEEVRGASYEQMDKLCKSYE